MNYFTSNKLSHLNITSFGVILLIELGRVTAWKHMSKLTMTRLQRNMTFKPLFYKESTIIEYQVFSY